MSEPYLIKGTRFIDDRGSVNFVNDFDFRGVKRHYLVKNFRKGFVRAWHGHQFEAKYVTIVHGAAIVGAVPVDNWVTPDTTVQPSRYVLSAEQPTILYIPAGYANGWMSLTDEATLAVYSTTTAVESKGDDFRFPARTWDIWTVEER